MQNSITHLLDEAKRQEIELPDVLLSLDPTRQSLQVYVLLQSEHPLRTYTISTSKFGWGNAEGSYKTPTGFHAVTDRIGAGEPRGRAFASREPLDQIVPAHDFHAEQDSDLILTRILRLDGLEEQNAHSFERYIYIHGTNQEQLLGTPASHGCIRMGNQDIIELFDLLGDHPAVCWIAPPEEPGI